MKFEWELLEAEEAGESTFRAKVVGGWMVLHKSFSMDGEAMSESMVFVPDQFEKWEIEE